MLGFLKSLLRKPQDTPAESEQVFAQENIPVAKAAHAAQPTRAATQIPVAKGAPPHRGPVQQNGKGVEIPLQKIIESLPLELQPRVTRTDFGNITISVPLEKVLAQLSRGVVKVSFGELRQAAPGVFSLENDRDRVLVALPLGEILARLNPALITRRRAQRQVAVPDEISSPFDAQSQSLVYSVAPGQAEAAPVTPPRHNGSFPSVPAAPPGPVAPVVPVSPVVPPASVVSARGSLSQTPIQTPPSAINPAPAAPRFTIAPPPPPAPPVAPTTVPHVVPAPAPISFPRTSQSTNTAPSVPPASPVVPPVRDTHTSHTSFTKAPQTSHTKAPQTSHTKAPQPASPVPAAPQPAAKPGNVAEPLLVGLTAMAEAWPEIVRKEIIDSNLVDAKVALPFNAIEQALKQGRIAFTWKTLRGWIKPAVLPAVSAHDSTVLELPLKIVAPLFLARQKEQTKHQQKVSVDEEIPNLFFGFPQAETATPVAAATARPADTNYYVWDENSDTAHIHESEAKRGPTPGTRFVAKYATPNEVVSRAAGLDGVAGALIALPDGLMVANRLPPEVNADTLAAFLPQIFGKMSQCTKELRMGELNNLNFTVGNVPWKIFRVNAIFFAAFGRAGEPLPTGQLASLAAELDHKPK